MKTKIAIIAAMLLISIGAKAQWQPTNGPYGGEVQCLATNGTSVFAGASNGSGPNLFRSNNNGILWTDISGSINSYGQVFALAINGVNIFAGTNYGLYLSTDNGNSWVAVNNGLTDSSILSILIMGNNIFVGTNGGGVYLSTNNGNSWAPANIGMPNTSVFSLVTNGTNIFAATSLGVYLSTNTGLTWTLVNNGFTSNWVNGLAVSGTTVYAATGGGVFQSTNNGTNWTAINGNLPFNGAYSISTIGSSIFIGSFITTNRGCLFKSIDNGNTWVPDTLGMITPINVAPPTVYSVISCGANIFCGSINGAYMSTDNGDTWFGKGFGLYGGSSNIVNCLATDSINIYAGTKNGIYFTSDDGNTWNAINNGLPTNLNVWSIAVSGSNIFAGTQKGIYLSTNAGNNWTLINNSGINDSTWIQSIAINGNSIFAGSGALGHPLYLSTNNGASWINLTSAFSAYYLTVDNPVIFASTNNGIYITTDNGNSWTTANTGLTNGGGAIGANGPLIFTASGGGTVYSSANYASSWTVTSFPSGNYVDAIVIFGSKVFAGCYSTTGVPVFLSSDNGNTWASDNGNMRGIISFVIKGSKIFAGTNGDPHGVWERSLTGNLGIEDIKKNSGISVYPNPTTSNLTIKANLNLTGSTYTIIDLTGRILITGKLTNEITNISIEELAAGFYLFQIEGQQGQSIKIIKN